MTIETKYNENDVVWFMRDNKPASRKPMGFKIDCTYHGNSGQWGSNAYPIIVSYLIESMNNNNLWINETSLFPSKEELLKSL